MKSRNGFVLPIVLLLAVVVSAAVLFLKFGVARSPLSTGSNRTATTTEAIGHVKEIGVDEKKLQNILPPLEIPAQVIEDPIDSNKAIVTTWYTNPQAGSQVRTSFFLVDPYAPAVTLLGSYSDPVRVGWFTRIVGIQDSKVIIYTDNEQNRHDGCKPLWSSTIGGFAYFDLNAISLGVRPFEVPAAIKDRDMSDFKGCAAQLEASAVKGSAYFVSEASSTDPSFAPDIRSAIARATNTQASDIQLEAFGDSYVVYYVPNSTGEGGVFFDIFDLKNAKVSNSFGGAFVLKTSTVLLYTDGETICYYKPNMPQCVVMPETTLNQEEEYYWDPMGGKTFKVTNHTDESFDITVWSMRHDGPRIAHYQIP